MRNGLKLAALFGLLGALAVTATAADLAPALKANVPFGFTAGNAQFPAGTYTVERHSAPGILVVRAEQGPVAVIRVNAAYSPARGSAAKLVFRKYGDNYFLAEIWTAGPAAGFQLPQSRREKEMMAKGDGAEETVVAVLR